MKIIIAGSREIKNLSILAEAYRSCPFQITEIVSGGARGVDTMGENLAKVLNLPIKRFDASWDKYGRSAGMIRNKEMADYADGLIAIWDGKSPGTKGMIKLMNKQVKPVHLWLEEI